MAFEKIAACEILQKLSERKKLIFHILLYVLFLFFLRLLDKDCRYGAFKAKMYIS